MGQKAYAKPFLTIDDQVRLLESRGMTVPDQARAADVLRKVGYYRLSGYWHLFRELPVKPTTQVDAEAPGDEQSGANGDQMTTNVLVQADGEVTDTHDGAVRAAAVEGPRRPAARPVERRLSSFMPSTTFEDVEAIYDFDRTLRMHVFDALETLEVALRARVGYLVGQGHAFAHRDPRHLHSAFTGQDLPVSGMEYSSWLDSKHADWLRDVDREETRSSETFVMHFREKYGPPLPIWAATEIMSFGTLVRLYSGMDRAQQNRIAAAVGLFGAKGQGDGSTLANWLNHLRYVRNLCAHHARLWNRNMTVQLADPSHVGELDHLDERSRSRIYGTLAVLSFLLARVAPASTWRVTVTKFVEEGAVRMGQPLSSMGFPDDWRGQRIWDLTYTHPDPTWEARQDLLDRLPSITAGDLGRLLRPEETTKKQGGWLRYLRSHGVLLGLKQGDSYVYPSFQVDNEELAVLPAVAHANQLLLAGSLGGDDSDQAEAQWAAARWWSMPLAELGDRAPREVSDDGTLTEDLVERILNGGTQTEGDSVSPGSMSVDGGR